MFKCVIMAEENKMDKIIGFCKRRGFVYPSSEIYGGFAAVYDYGPYGVELKNAIRDAWWKNMVKDREDIVGLDAAIFMLPKVWEASGHVGGFADPLSECKKCHTRSRVDHLLEDAGVFADEKMSEEEINKIFNENKKKIKCLKCGGSDFSEARSFNLLVKSNLGNFTGDWDKEPTYLRPETAQGIFVNYLNVQKTGRMKIPFGIAQIGKAFRNEIVARQFIFRMREFEQMEMQFFVRPGEEIAWFEKWKEARLKWHLALGLGESKYRFHNHEKLAHYANAAADIEFEFPFGFKELEGIHSRTDFDLSQHQKFSGKKMQYFDPETNENYVPYVVETSIGLDRTFLAIYASSYCEEKLENGEDRVVLRLPAFLAPVKLAVLPLVKKDGLPEFARKIMGDLKYDVNCQYDEKDSIGKRYRRQDAIGTPFCITIDHQSLTDNTVTIRYRDSMEQERVSVENLRAIVEEKVSMRKVLEQI